MRWAAAALVCLLAAACGGGSHVRVSLADGDDRAAQRLSDDTLTVTVTSADGIGGLLLEPGEGGFPERVMVRLPLRGLERVTVRSGVETRGAAVASHGERVVRHWRSTAPRGTEVPLTAADPRAVTVRTLAGGGDRIGGFAVDIPGDLLRRGDPIDVRWVDFFRY